MPSKNTDSKKAQQGEKMIEIKVRFWTNDLAAKEGHVIPKHGWTAGAVRMERNDAHGIIPSDPMLFHSLLDLSAVIEKVLTKHGVVLHPSARMKKYIADKS